MVARFAEKGIEQSVEIKYRGIPNSSPVFDGLAHDITAKFGILHVMVSLLTVDKLLGLLDKTFSDFDDKRIQQKPVEQAPSKHGVVVKPVVKKADDFMLVKVHATFQSLGVSFPATEGLFMEAFMNRSIMDVTMTDSSFLHVEGSLGALSIDYNNEEIKAIYPHLVAIRGENLVSFSVDYQLGDELTLPLPDDALPNRVAYNALVNLNMSSVQFIYAQKFIEDIVAFFLT